MTGFDSTVMKVTRVARLVVIASVLCVAAVSNSNAACTAATTHTLSPAACGVVISTAGCYNMTTNLVATSNSGDCVLITAANVYLNLTDVSIKGTGAASTSNGIHVASTAAGATIVGGTVSGFDIGILAAARGVLEAPDAESNKGDGIQLNSAASSKIVSGASTSNGGNGVTITGSNSFTMVSFDASNNNGSGTVVNTSSAGDITNETANSNALSGITLNKSNSTNIPGLIANNNGTYGVEVVSSTSNKIFGTTINLNGIYGVYLKESSSNVVASPGGTIHCNGIIDVYLGCSDTAGPNGAACATASSANEIDGAIVFGTGVNPYGIVIDLGNIGNKVLASNGATDTIDDMYDANKAGQNTWFGNVFTTANQSYIH
ncbi:NosD domain-containing protein [Candidatus Binatus sp.]|uniref:NosD domain-containing protein n=1 Tax=Candidatus Binatus sp. TaxID=2811406 RepID=UPI003BB15AC5